MNLSLGGCSVNVKFRCFQLRFKENDTVYIKPKAERGLLRKITIKLIIINGKTVIYQDTFNSLHNQYDLISKEEAVRLATIYYENQILQTQNTIDSLGC